MPPINYNAMVQQLQNSLLMPVADKTNPLANDLNPGNGLTEGGRAYGGTAGRTAPTPRYDLDRELAKPGHDSFWDSKVSPFDYEKELRNAKLTHTWWEENRNRDFNDLPTNRELMTWIRARAK